MDAKGDVTKLKTFVNTVLGETWKETGDVPEWQQIYNRRESFERDIVPEPVAFITCGVDVQKDRLELELVGWAPGKRSYSLDYRVLLGDTSKMEVWEMLSEIVTEQFKQADGAVLPVRLMAIDTGYNTTHVYDFARKFDWTKVIPVKGQDALASVTAPPKDIDYLRTGRKVGKVKIWHVGVSLLKSELYGLLRLEKDENGISPPGYCYFPEFYGPEHFKGLTAEQMQVVKSKKGYSTYQWIKKYERNEQLDCRNYARAAAYVIGMDRFTEADWHNMHRSHANMEIPFPKKPKRTRENSFLAR